MFSVFLKREWLLLWKHRGRATAIAIFALLCVWSAATGLSWQAETERVLAETPAQVLAEKEAWLSDLKRIEAGEEVSPYAARPMNFTVLALDDPAPLAALAYREEALQPHSATINGWRSDASLFRRYEVQGPSTLWAGRLDLAFLVVAVLPLLLLVLTFDVLTRERESGRLALFLVQGGSVASLLLARILSVAAPLALLPVAVVAVVASLQGATAGSAILWIVTVLAYTAVWAGLAASIAIRFQRTTSAALAVLALWSLVIVFLPSGAQFLAEAVYPVPSRVAYLSEARDAEAAARRNIEQRAEIYMAEHPGQADEPDEAVPGFYHSAYLANADINARTRPLVEALESQQAAQRRMVRLAGLLSPAIVAQTLLQDASGTGPARSADFRREAREYLNGLLDVIGPATVGQSRISLEQALAIPPFQSGAREPGAAFLPVLWLGLLVAGLTLWVRFAVRRVGIAD